MKSSNSPEGGPESGDAGEPLVSVATGLKLRGAGGRLTASLIPGGIDQFQGRTWVSIGRQGQALTHREIETYTIYGRKVVIKLKGVDSAAAAEVFEGQDILMACKGLVDLPDGAYYIFELVGMRVSTRAGLEVGLVRRVIANGGAPLLVIERSGDGPGGSRELLVPAARAICSEIDRVQGRITIDPPEGLLEL